MTEIEIKFYRLHVHVPVVYYTYLVVEIIIFLRKSEFEMTLDYKLMIILELQ